MELQKLHEKLFEILDYFDGVCKKLGLTYYLGYGTLLGAVRHNGFIPWDDDLDVWMERKDFQKLLDYYRTQNDSDRFVINEGDVKPKGDHPSELQIRIVDKKVKLLRPMCLDIVPTFAWIDVFTLDSYPIKKQKSYLKTFNRKIRRYKIARCKTLLFDDGSFLTKINRVIYKLHNKYGFFKHCFIEKKEIARSVKHLSKYAYDNESDGYFCYCSAMYRRPEKCLFKKEWFAETVELTFEGKKFLAPKNYHEVLTTLYGDYMQIPDEKDRKTHDVEVIEIE